MKKILILMIILVVAGSGAFGQTITYGELEASFSQFSADVAESLPFASTIGLNWSDARVRSFPHFGIGLTVGAVTIPKEAFVELSNAMGFTLPSEITDSDLGVPLPGYAVEGRIGGLILPFDIGIKLGYIPPELFSDSEVAADYMLAGFDIRTPIIKGNVLLPAVALSIGYNYMNAGIETAVDTGLGSGIDLTPYGLQDITFTDPKARFQMQSNVVDIKLQASKSLLIITPYAGLGYAYGWSKAGGGVAAGDVLYGGNPITSADIDAINAALAAVGESELDVSADGFLVSSASTGGSFRAFGGLSVNLFILKLDLNAMYNVNTASLGASLNARVAF